MMPVAKPARPARKPSAAQLRVLRRMANHGAYWRMANHGAYLRAEAFHTALHFADGERWLPVLRVTFDAMRDNGLIEPYAAMGANHWRVSDAGRRAAE